MYLLNISDDHDSFTKCRDNENKDNMIILKYSLLLIPSGVLSLSIISLILYTTIKPLITNI